MSAIERLWEIMLEHERKLGSSFSLIPSENVPSPLSRFAFLSDAFSRYFFDEKEVFGMWSFEGGSIAGKIQTDILVPILKRLGEAEYVNVHPVSGLTGMTLILATFGGTPGARVLSVPVAAGGHPDTAYVGRKLGLHVDDLPFASWADPDLGALADRVNQLKPTLVYIDHATSLFPLNLADVVGAIRSAGGNDVHVHVDTSHVNGLVWGGEIPNPLACGADTYGGSTHKTFPGPHKAVLFTNDAGVAERLTLTAVNMISHHHLSSVIALAIACIEFEECGGQVYAKQVIKNAQAFAVALAGRGFDVQAPDRGYTACHQVWIDTPTGWKAHDASSRLFEAGIVVNPFDPLPSLGSVGIRMGVNEATRLGLVENDLESLSVFMARVVLEHERAEHVQRDIQAFRQGFAPTYCYDTNDFDQTMRNFMALTRL